MAKPPYDELTRALDSGAGGFKTFGQNNLDLGVQDGANFRTDVRRVGDTTITSRTNGGFPSVETSTPEGNKKKDPSLLHGVIFHSGATPTHLQGWGTPYIGVGQPGENVPMGTYDGDLQDIIIDERRKPQNISPFYNLVRGGKQAKFDNLKAACKLSDGGGGRYVPKQLEYGHHICFDDGKDVLTIKPGGNSLYTDHYQPGTQSVYYSNGKSYNGVASGGHVIGVCKFKGRTIVVNYLYNVSLLHVYQIVDPNDETTWVLLASHPLTGTDSVGWGFPLTFTFTKDGSEGVAYIGEKVYGGMPVGEYYIGVVYLNMATGPGTGEVTATFNRRSHVSGGLWVTESDVTQDTISHNMNYNYATYTDLGSMPTIWIGAVFTTGGWAGWYPYYGAASNQNRAWFQSTDQGAVIDRLQAMYDENLDTGNPNYGYSQIGGARYEYSTYGGEGGTKLYDTDSAGDIDGTADRTWRLTWVPFYRHKAQAQWNVSRHVVGTQSGRHLVAVGYREIPGDTPGSLIEVPVGVFVEPSANFESERELTIMTREIMGHTNNSNSFDGAPWVYSYQHDATLIKKSEPWVRICFKADTARNGSFSTDLGGEDVMLDGALADFNITSSCLATLTETKSTVTPSFDSSWIVNKTWIYDGSADLTYSTPYSNKTLSGIIRMVDIKHGLIAVQQATETYDTPVVASWTPGKTNSRTELSQDYCTSIGWSTYAYTYPESSITPRSILENHFSYGHIAISATVQRGASTTYETLKLYTLLGIGLLETDISPAGASTTPVDTDPNSTYVWDYFISSVSSSSPLYTTVKDTTPNLYWQTHLYMVDTAMLCYKDAVYIYAHNGYWAWQPPWNNYAIVLHPVRDMGGTISGYNKMLTELFVGIDTVTSEKHKPKSWGYV